MADVTGRSRLGHYFPHMVAATTSVTVAPILIVTALERSGILSSLWLSILFGMALSILAAILGSALWMRRGGSKDLVFGDLMLWGYLRRLRNERDVGEMIGLLEEADSADDPTVMSPAERIKVLQKLAAALEVTDPYTHGHTLRVARHSESIAVAMRLPHETVNKIRTAAAVHDVGKLRTPAEVLNKPGKLSDDEFEMMKLHAVYGAEMVEAVGDPELTALVRHHHERTDGRGYPDRLAGDEIPIGARIIAVADTFDAITSSRVYRSASHHRKAIEILKKEAGAQLDDEAVEAFLSYYSGRSSKEWWAAVTTAPQRLIARALTMAQQAGSSAVAGTAAAAGLAAVIGSAALVGPVVNHPERRGPERLVETVVASAPEDETDPAVEDSVSVVPTDSRPNTPEKLASLTSQQEAAGTKDGGKGKQGEPGSGGGGEGGSGSGGGSGTGSGSGDGSGTGSGGGSTNDSTSGTAPAADGGGGAIDDTVDTVDEVVDDTVDVVDDTVDTVDDVVDDTVDTVDDVVDGTVEVVDDVVDVVDGVAGGLLP